MAGGGGSDSFPSCGLLNKKTNFAPLYFHATFVINQGAIYIERSISGLCSVPLVYSCVLVSVSHCLNNAVLYWVFIYGSLSLAALLILFIWKLHHHVSFKTEFCLCISSLVLRGIHRPCEHTIPSSPFFLYLWLSPLFKEKHKGQQMNEWMNEWMSFYTVRQPWTRFLTLFSLSFLLNWFVSSLPQVDAVTRSR